MIINYAKYIKQSDVIEEEVDLEINGILIKGFAQLYPFSYALEEEKVFPVELTLFMMDYEFDILENKKFSVEPINDGFSYYLYGKVENDILKLGNFDIQDEVLLLMPEIDGKFIRLKVDRINVEFIEFEE